MTIVSAKQWYKDVANSLRESFLEREVLTRVLNLSGSVGNTIHSICSLGSGGLEMFMILFPKDWSWTNRQVSILESFYDARFSEVVYGLITTINPHAKIDREAKLTSYYADQIKAAGKTYRSSDSLLDKHIKSRLTFALYALVAPITRLFDLAIGTFALALALLTVGCFEEFNSKAFAGFDGTLFIHDLLFGFFKFLNPDLSMGKT